MNLLEIKNFTKLEKTVSKSKLEKLKKMNSVEKFEAYRDKLEYEDILARQEKAEAANKKWGPVKKVAKKIFKGLASVAIIAGVALGGINVSNSLQVNDINNYKTQNQIVLDAKEFGAEMELAKVLGRQYRHNNFIRLRHNNGAPIRVYISNNFNEDYKQLISNSLDYVENLFQDINDKYHFKIVDKREFDFYRTIGHTAIKYNDGLESDKVGGINSARVLMLNNNFIGNADISINVDLLEKYPDNKEYILLHELLHAFGLGDNLPYLSSLHYNSIMHNGEIARHLNEVYSNDYKMLQALYNVSYLDGSTVNVFERNKIIENINNFEQEFYKKVAKYNLGSEYNKLTEIKQEDLNEISLNQLSIYSSQNQVYQIKLTFNDNEYLYTIKDLDDNIIEEFKGNYVKVDNFIVLNDLHFKNAYNWKYGYYDTGVISSQLITKTSDFTYKTFGIIDTGIVYDALWEKDKDYELKDSYNFDDLENKYLTQQELTR